MQNQAADGSPSANAPGRFASGTTVVSRFRSKQRWRCACGASLCVLALTVFAGGATLLRPPTATQIVAVGASYAENLTIPHNAYGWNGLEDLCELAAADTPQFYLSHRLLRSPNEPLVVTAKLDWQKALQDATGETTVVFLSMHGGADDEGPYLLAEDCCDADANNGRLRLDGLWAALAALPDQQRKLLLIDVTTRPGMWRQAIVANTFAAGLKSQSARIAAIPNLTVICASDEDQRSWVDLNECRTSFSHYALSGLSGYAEDTNHDGRITALELFAHVQSGVRGWCESRCHAQQVPFMLPADRAGELRADGIEVALAASHKNLQPPVVSTVATESIAAVWNTAEALHARLKTPETVAPTLWRDYLETVLRFEQLTLARDDAGAKRVAQLVERVQMQLEDAVAMRTRMLDAVQISVDAGLIGPQSGANQNFNQLWQGSLHHISATWNKTLDQTPTDEQPALRRRMYDHLLSRVLESPSKSLPRAAEIIRLTDNALQPRPSEIHFVAMLDQHLPATARAAEFDGTLRTAIACRIDAERLLTSVATYGDSLTATTLNWIAEPLVEIDRDRAAAEDLLFAGATRLTEAHDLLEAVADRYAELRERIELIQHATAVRDRAFDMLPYYSDWWANVWPETDQQSLDAGLTGAWTLAHALADLLESGDDRAIKAVEFDRVHDELQQRSLALEKEVAGLEREFRMWRAKLVNQTGPKFWNNRNAAMLVPDSDIAERLRMLMAKRRTASDPAGDGPKQMHLSRDGETRSAFLSGAERRTKLAVAALGQRTFELGGGEPRRFQELAALFQDENDEPNRTLPQLSTLGAELATCKHAAHTRLDDLLRSAENAGNTADDAQWRRLADLRRRTLFWHPSEKSPSPIVERQRRDRTNYSLWQANRAWQECWNGDSPEQPTYYQVAAIAYLKEARNWMPDAAAIQRLQQQVMQPLVVQFAGRRPNHDVNDVDLVGDFSPPVWIQLKTDRDCHGTGLVWATAGDGLELVAPAADNRVLCPLDAADRPNTVSVEFRTSEPLASLPKQHEPIATAVELHGFYRGHRITKRVEVRLHTAAQIESTSPPRPEQGAVALVASAATNQQHRQGDGGVALVLDASGSMGPVDGATTFKYQTAVTAVGKLLTEMPAGVEVSVWVFGEAIGLGKTTDRAEQTIRRIMRPVRWDPNDTELLGELVERLSYPNVEPWNESPIARAVLAAADDLAAVEGFRSIVVVTDGMDNRFDRDLVANPSGRSLGDVLADALIDRGISMHVVGFRLAGDQQTQARAQFRFVEQLSPPGRWWEVDQQEGLEIALRRALKRNLEVELNPTDAKTNASVSLPVAPGGDVIRWSRGVLAPGTYQLDSQAKAPPVAVQGGDLLLLELAGSRPHFTAGRLGYANTMFPWRPTVLGDAWQTSLLAHRQATETNVEMLVALETRTDLAETPPVELIELQRPADVWFEYGVDRPDHARMLHWKSAWGHPAPCWQLSATAGDDDHEPATAPRELRVWWTNTADGTASRALRRGHDFTKPAKLAGTTWDVNGRDVQVLRLAVDAQELPAGDGSVRRQNCLTVELQVAPSSISSQLVKVRPVGLPEVGEQHQFFPEVGRYVGRFWPITSEQLENLVAGVDFVAIDQLKGEAESRGQYAELTELGPPSPTDQVPPPEINLFGGQSCYVKPRTHSN